MATTPTHALETLPLRAGMARAALLSLLVACVGAVSTGPIALQHRVCIFDFDDTIKMDDDSVARGAKYVVDACAARGYKLGLATAGCSTSYAKKYLAQRVDPDQWTPDVLNSQAFQSCQPVKRYSIPPILQHYGIAGAPGCAVLFDQEFNRKFAVETNVSFQAVDERTGLTPRDFALAEQQLERNCP